MTCAPETISMTASSCAGYSEKPRSAAHSTKPRYAASGSAPRGTASSRFTGITRVCQAGERSPGPGRERMLRLRHEGGCDDSRPGLLAGGVRVQAPVEGRLARDE